jgi:hypothetical protein
MTIDLVGVTHFTEHFKPVHPGIVAASLGTFNADLKAGHSFSKRAIIWSPPRSETSHSVCNKMVNYPPLHAACDAC